MKQLLLSKLPALFAALAAEQKLYIPADDAAGQANFTLWREGLQLTKKLNTVRSAKDLFFPQVENLVGFRVTGKQLDLVETRDPAEPFVLFGVRACDARSFAILDRVFLSEPQDTYYAARRAHGTVVTLACTRPEETCFCQAFGVDPAQPQGDVSCWMDAKALYWQANTEKGEALTAKLSMLRHLYFRVPHLPVLRHQGIRLRQARPPLPLLGQLHVLGLHQDVRRSAAPDPARALPPAFYAQAGLFPG